MSRRFQTEKSHEDCGRSLSSSVTPHERSSPLGGARTRSNLSTWADGASPWDSKCHTEAVPYGGAFMASHCRASDPAQSRNAEIGRSNRAGLLAV